MQKHIEKIAKVCHEANRAYRESIADHSQSTWENAPEWQKQSAINGVKFHLANPNAGPSASHDSWLEEKKRDGWQYGPVKNPALKQHPCFVPYEQLPVEQKSKDYIFTSIVHAMADKVPALRNSVTQGGIDSILAASTFTDMRMGDKTTVVCCKLPNGFEVIESSGCVDPVNYNHDMGVSICRERIINKIWMLEGYALASAIAAFK